MKPFFSIFILLTLTHSVMAQSTGQYANVNGLKMYYEVHGGGSTIGTSFGRILPALAQTNRITRNILSCPL